MELARDTRVRRLAAVGAALAICTTLSYGALLRAAAQRPTPTRSGVPTDPAFTAGFSWLILALSAAIGLRFAWSYLCVARAPELDLDDASTLRARRANAIWSGLVLSATALFLTVYGPTDLLGWLLPALAAALAWTVCATLAVRAAAHLR